MRGNINGVVLQTDLLGNGAFVRIKTQSRRPHRNSVCARGGCVCMGGGVPSLIAYHIAY